LLRPLGYATACVGKWGLGAVGSSGDPNAQGFDLFFGFICQRVAHNYYPRHLWLNGQQLLLDNPPFAASQRVAAPPASYTQFHGNEYAPDRLLSTALGFIRQQQQRDQPFFLYLPLVEPHLAMQPPQHLVEQYPMEWDRETGPYLGTKGYLPHPRPRAGYAAMISHLDEHVGRVVALVDGLGLGASTLILFSSDNGPTHDVGGVDTEFFQSAGPLRGRKGSVFEGGLRVPMIARWTRQIPPGTTSDHVCGFQDVLPTLLQVASGKAAVGHDGVSFLPTLRGERQQPGHPHLVWEFHGYGGQQAIRMGNWKGVRRNLRKGLGRLELYDLANDVSESTDVAAQHPEVIAELEQILRAERTPSAAFPMESIDRER
jgi:arylsulfatase